MSSTEDTSSKASKIRRILAIPCGLSLTPKLVWLTRCHSIDARLNEGVRAVVPAVRRQSSNILKHVTAAAASASSTVVGGTRRSSTEVVPGPAGGAAAGDDRRTRLLNVAMRSKTAAAAVEGSSYEDEVRWPGSFADLEACSSRCCTMVAEYAAFCPCRPLRRTEYEVIPERVEQLEQRRYQGCLYCRE